MGYDVVLFTGLDNTITLVKALGTTVCASELRSHGYSVFVVDHFHEYNISEIKSLLERVLSKDTLLVGFSNTYFSKISQDSSVKLTTDNFDQTYELCPQGDEFEKELISFIKENSPGVKVAVGGAGAAGVFSNTAVDYVFIGFAERTLVELANFLRNGLLPSYTSYKNLYGITVIQEMSSIWEANPVRWNSVDVANHKVLPIEMSRGCIFDCTFCAFPLKGKKSNDHLKPFDRVKQELEYNYNTFGIYRYTIVDDTFNDSEYKLDKILEAVKSLPFQPEFWAYTRLDLVSSIPGMLDKLYDIGIRSMFFGIETFNREAGKVVKKGADPLKQIATLQRIRNTYPDIMTHGSFILGIPGETKESMMNTYRLIRSGEAPLHSYLGSVLKLYPENKAGAFLSEFSKNYSEYGFTIIPKQEGTMFSKVMPWKTDEITFYEAEEFSKTFNSHAKNIKCGYRDGMFNIGLPHMFQGSSEDILKRKSIFSQLHKKTMLSKYQSGL